LDGKPSASHFPILRQHQGLLGDSHNPSANSLSWLDLLSFVQDKNIQTDLIIMDFAKILWNQE
jgi:hypothetical protein